MPWKNRYTHWKLILWGPVMGIVGGIYGTIAAVALVRDEIVKPDPPWHLIDVIPHWPAATWIIIGLVLLVGCILEGSFRYSRQETLLLTSERSAKDAPIADLSRRLGDAGPIITIRQTAYSGLVVTTDREICGLRVEEIRGPDYLITFEVLSGSVVPDTQALLNVKLERDVNGMHIAASGSDPDWVLDSWCWAEFKGSIPLEVEYWDCRSNKYCVRWEMNWGLDEAVSRVLCKRLSVG